MVPTKKNPARGRAGPAAGDDDIGRRIVTAAADAIVEHGFSGASTDAIARAARTSKRSIYERFPDRDALFEHVMAHLCSQAGERPDEDSEAAVDEALPLDILMVEWGYAVLLRFSRPRARRVLAAAIGVQTTFPEALTIFWRCGPGVAVDAVADALEAAVGRGEIALAEPKAAARRFIAECCGPLVLEQLFDATVMPSDAELKRRVESVAERLLKEWRAR